MNEPLNFYKIFGNYFSGSMEIFIFVSLLFLAILAAKMSMPVSIYLLMIGAYALLLHLYFGSSMLIILFIIVFGWVSFWLLSKFIK